MDEAVYRGIEGQETRSLDRGLRLLSTAANKSVLWLGIAGAMAALGGPRGRRAAVRGVVSIGVTSAAVNIYRSSCTAEVVSGGARVAFVEATVAGPDGRVVARASSIYLY